MSNFYTVKQVQEILKVDRITVYRMLQDGRLTAAKIGHQWRFRQEEIDRFLGEKPAPETRDRDLANGLPTHCIQAIQNLFSDISQMSSVVVDMQGNPITPIRHACEFCSTINAAPAGAEACRASWQQMAQSCTGAGKTGTCHAGLNYTAAPILDDGVQIGAFISCQYYEQSPDRYEEAERVKSIAAGLKLQPEVLQTRVLNIKIMPAESRGGMALWSRSSATAIHSILEERTGLIIRLQKIANLTQIS